MNLFRDCIDCYSASSQGAAPKSVFSSQFYSRRTLHLSSKISMFSMSSAIGDAISPNTTAELVRRAVEVVGLDHVRHEALAVEPSERMAS